MPTADNVLDALLIKVGVAGLDTKNTLLGALTRLTEAIAVARNTFVGVLIKVATADPCVAVRILCGVLRSAATPVPVVDNVLDGNLTNTGVAGRDTKKIFAGARIKNNTAGAVRRNTLVGARTNVTELVAVAANSCS